MLNSPLITFSGSDGAGKTTQINLLLDHLRQQGQRPVYLWVRGGYTPLFVKIKALLRRAPGGNGVMPPVGQSAHREQRFGKPWVRGLWLTLSLLDLMLTYGVLVRWWQMRGRAVVCDRYLWDTELDFQINFPQEQVATWWLYRLLEKVVPRPTVSFLLLLPVEESVRRSKLKNEPFPDTPEVLAKRLAFYRNAPAHWRCQILDGRCTVAELAAEIREHLAARARTAHNYPGAAESSASIQG
jgi:dTMP kinase